MNIKEQLYNQCLEFVETRFQTIKNTINEIQESLTSETKSSAGDKHETGRAMLQLEREKAGNQLAEIQKVKEALSRIDVDKTSTKIGLGSVVYTTQANYFIAISAGALHLDSKTYYAISPSTPIANLLLSKSAGDNVIFRGNTIKINQIL